MKQVAIIATFLIVELSRSIEAQSQLDCSGRSSVCVGPVSFKKCIEKNGVMVTDNEPAQLCPSGYRCASSTPEACIPINPTRSSRFPANETQNELSETVNVSEPANRSDLIEISKIDEVKPVEISHESRSIKIVEKSTILSELANVKGKSELKNDDMLLNIIAKSNSSSKIFEPYLDEQGTILSQTTEKNNFQNSVLNGEAFIESEMSETRNIQDQNATTTVDNVVQNDLRNSQIMESQRMENETKENISNVLLEKVNSALVNRTVWNESNSVPKSEGEKISIPEKQLIIEISKIENNTSENVVQPNLVLTEHLESDNNDSTGVASDSLNSTLTMVPSEEQSQIDTSANNDDIPYNTLVFVSEKDTNISNSNDKLSQSIFQKPENQAIFHESVTRNILIEDKQKFKNLSTSLTFEQLAQVESNDKQILAKHLITFGDYKNKNDDLPKDETQSNFDVFASQNLERINISTYSPPLGFEIPSNISNKIIYRSKNFTEAVPERKDSIDLNVQQISNFKVPTKQVNISESLPPNNIPFESSFIFYNSTLAADLEFIHLNQEIENATHSNADSNEDRYIAEQSGIIQVDSDNTLRPKSKSETHKHNVIYKAEFSKNLLGQNREPSTIEETTIASDTIISEVAFEPMLLEPINSENNINSKTKQQTQKSNIKTMYLNNVAETLSIQLKNSSKSENKNLNGTKMAENTFSKSPAMYLSNVGKSNNNQISQATGAPINSEKMQKNENSSKNNFREPTVQPAGETLYQKSLQRQNTATRDQSDSLVIEYSLPSNAKETITQVAESAKRIDWMSENNLEPNPDLNKGPHSDLILKQSSANTDDVSQNISNSDSVVNLVATSLVQVTEEIRSVEANSDLIRFYPNLELSNFIQKVPQNITENSISEINTNERGISQNIPQSSKSMNLSESIETGVSTGIKYTKEVESNQDSIEFVLNFTPFNSSKQLPQGLSQGPERVIKASGLTISQNIPANSSSMNLSCPQQSSERDGLIQMNVNNMDKPVVAALMVSSKSEIKDAQIQTNINNTEKPTVVAVMISSKSEMKEPTDTEINAVSEWLKVETFPQNTSMSSKLNEKSVPKLFETSVGSSKENNFQSNFSLNSISVINHIDHNSNPSNKAYYSDEGQTPSTNLKRKEIAFDYSPNSMSVSVPTGLEKGLLKDQKLNRFETLFSDKSNQIINGTSTSEESVVSDLLLKLATSEESFESPENKASTESMETIESIEIEKSESSNSESEEKSKNQSSETSESKESDEPQKESESKYIHPAMRNVLKKKKNFACNSKGVFPDLSNRRKYFTCDFKNNKFLKNHEKCQKNHIFDIKTLRCVHQN